MTASEHSQALDLSYYWSSNKRWNGTRRDYTPEQVIRLRPSLKVEYSLARHGAERLWKMMHAPGCVSALGCLNGSQAVQMVKAGLKSLYISGWQVAADGNIANQTYPDQSLYPSNSVPALVRRLNNALTRADQINKLEGKQEIDWYVPIIADAEAGFGGAIHAFELMKAMIDAGAAGAHFEDQLASEKKCGHMGGKVLVPASQFIRTLAGARLAADVLDVPSILVARTDAHGANYITSDIDERDARFIDTSSRTEEGYFKYKAGLAAAISRGIIYGPLADMLWFETSKPDIGEAREFAQAIHERYPGKPLAYNCSPSFNWRKHLRDKDIANFRENLAVLGYKYQFVTLAGWHSINLNAFELAAQFLKEGMPAYVRLQEREFSAEKHGYTATRHQREVGAAYFDDVLMTLSAGAACTGALEGSTEAEQFKTGGGKIGAA